MASTVSLTKLDGLRLEVSLLRKTPFFKPDHEWLVNKIAALKQSVGSSDEKIPFKYQAAVLDPFFDFLLNINKLGRNKFDAIFSPPSTPLEPDEEYYKNSIPQIAEALLQINCDDISFRSDLEAFQAAVSDLYSDIIIVKVLSLLQRKLAPLVKWAPSDSPHTIPTFDKHQLKLEAGVVSLPPEYRHGGLLVWATLGHEVAGHNFIHSHQELLRQLKKNVEDAVRKCTTDENIIKVWKQCTEETACDVLSTLTIGPVAVVSLIGYFRGINLSGKLSNKGQCSVLHPPHPPQWLRAYMGIQIIRECFGPVVSKEWLEPLSAEIEGEKPANVVFVTLNRSSDPPNERESNPIPIILAMKTADAAAKAIATVRLQCLKRKLVDVVKWGVQDEFLASEIQRAISSNKENLPVFHFGDAKIHASHIMSGTIKAALMGNQSPDRCFQLMKKYLIKMHHAKQFTPPRPEKQRQPKFKTL